MGGLYVGQKQDCEFWKEWYHNDMTKVSEIREAAAELPSGDRAELAAFLLGGLDNTHYAVDDAEVRRRSDELDSGAVKGLTHEEFLKACGRR